jgi:hypothetical protein
MRWELRSLNGTCPRFSRLFEASLANSLGGSGGKPLYFSHTPEGR